MNDHSDKVMDDSLFAMWRAVVAMVHADGIVTPHEVSFVNEQIRDLHFSENQLAQLSEDFKEPQDITEMFSNIKSPQDKKAFFMLARALSWCDGDLAEQDEHIIEVLEHKEFAVEDRAILEESRENMSEIELCGKQWLFKNTSNTQGQSMFNFLGQLLRA